MYCAKCGKSLPDNALFCSSCGARVDGAPTGAVREGDMAQAPSEGSAPSGNRKKPLIIIVVVAVVVALIGVGAYAFLSHKAYEDAHRPITVSIALEIEDSSTGSGSGVPFVVEGTDLDGAGVSQQVILDRNGGQIELKRGDYVIRQAGSPVSDDGKLFADSSQAIEFSIAEDGVRLPGGTGSIAFSYRAVPPEEVTDEQIQAVREWMASFGLSGETADAFAAKVATARQAEIDRIAEEKRKAEEEAQRRAAEEREARRDKLTGTFASSGAGAPRGHVSSIVFDDGEVIVAGELFRMENGSMRESVGDKTWVFGIDDDTEVGFSIYDGFHQQSIDEVAGYWASGNFPSIIIEIENGMVTRMYQSA